MRRFQALLAVAGLAAAPMSALAGPTDSHEGDRSVDVFEWSMAKGRLGITLMGLTPELRTHFGAASTQGVLVARVEAGSPAAKAGVRVGDVLTKTNEQSVDDAQDVLSAIANEKKGDAVDLAVIRDHKAMNLKAVLSDDPPPPMPSMESFWSKDWFHDFMKGFDEMRTPSHAPKRT
jgi:membrane-associated protease RseP (regulator of RpoE activity)